MVAKASARFELNRAGLAELARSQISGAAMERIASRVAATAQRNGGRFTKGYEARRVTVDGTAGARAGTDYPFAHWDEWGNRFRAPRAPLRRALSSEGLLTKTKIVGK